MIQDIETSLDGTIKIVFQKGHHCVIIPQKRGYTLCVSSQVGCSVGCKFCYTAKMGFLSQLSPQEIVEQYDVAQDILKKYNTDLEHKNPKITAFVFMGMGEPLLNSRAVYKACDILNAKYSFSYKKMTISTSGIVREMKAFIEFKKPMKLALSLHSPNEDIRKKIMPITYHNSLQELVNVSNEYTKVYKDPIMIEYLLIKGLTDSKEDLNALLQLGFLEHTYINLIPLNGEMQINEKIYTAPDKECVLYWKSQIIEHKYKCFIRSTLGEDINAACGMLSNEK